MSKQRNFRPRSKLALDEEEDDTTVKPSAAAQSAPAQQKQQQQHQLLQKQAPNQAKAGVANKPSLLSFEEDGEGEDASRPIMGKKKDKDRSRSKFRGAIPLPEVPVVTTASQRTGAGEYTSDKLQALKQETFAFNAKASSTAKQESAPAPDAGIKLSGSFKPAGQPRDDRFSINPTALVPPASEGRGAAARTGMLPPAAKAGAGGVAGAGGDGPQGAAATLGASDEDEDGMEGHVIPDEQTIKLARAKRERLRQAHLAPDYVPLGGVSKLLASGGGAAQQVAQGPEAEAHSGSDAEPDLEDSMRIKFSAAGETAARQDPKMYARSIAVHDEEESFASEQLRNAVRRQQASMAAASTSAAPVMHGGGLMGSGHAAAGPVTRSRIQQISGLGASVLSALQDGVARLRASHSSTQSNLTRTEANLTASFAKVEQHEGDMKAASEKYTYVQQMRAYMADLCDCLAHKSAIVEELEDSLADLRDERASAARQMAKALEEEMLVPAAAAVSAAMGVLSRGGAPPAASAAAESALDEAEEALADAVLDAPDEIDEFGRNINIGKKREAEARRRQRKDAVQREQALLASVSAGGPVAIDQRDEWELEDEGQAARYTSRHKEIMEGGATVFADASEEYATLESVKQRLEEFKVRYPRDYASIYMHMSTPALFAPYVRLQLLHWDPLYADTAAGGTGGSGEVLEATAGFDKQAWYNTLFDFGMGATGDGGMADDDPDADLVPQLVRKLVLPIAHHLLAKCWEPCSVRQSSAVADILGDLCVYVPAEEEGMAGVLNSCVSALEGAVAACSLPPWPPAATGVSPHAQAVLSRRFRFALRLLRGISGFEGLLARPLLLQLALDRVVGQAMAPYLRTAVASATAAAPVLSAAGPSFNDLLPSMNVAVARIEAVASALSPEWFAGPQKPTEAAPLLEMATSLARSLETASGSGSSSKQQPQQRHLLTGLAGRMCKALQRLGQGAQAKQLASCYGLSL